MINYIESVYKLSVLNIEFKACKVLKCEFSVAKINLDSERN